jgi:2-polyprenyl-3-methyl-5-hydroxy-6-metoxy-1,4-benzoquinol methylase
MSAGAARLFAWLQDAQFYVDMHLDAVTGMANGDSRAWLDIGCGPGLLTRIAADKGYATRGVDRDPDMIEVARRLSIERRIPAEFAISDLETESARGGSYDIVSASSLLVVLPAPQAALHRLIGLTKPGGSVLAIEASNEMTRLNALTKIVAGKLGHRGYMLQVWAMFRSGRALSAETFNQPGLCATHRPLLGGMANAWVIKRSP